MKNNALPKEWRYAKSHLQDLIVRDVSKGISTRSDIQQAKNYAFTYQIVLKNVNDALEDEY